MNKNGDFDTLLVVVKIDVPKSGIECGIMWVECKTHCLCI